MNTNTNTEPNIIELITQASLFAELKHNEVNLGLHMELEWEKNRLTEINLYDLSNNPMRAQIIHITWHEELFNYGIEIQANANCSLIYAMNLKQVQEFLNQANIIK
jgi:alpha-glucosidase (family GH31 glycosyl hydrolase)